MTSYIWNSFSLIFRLAHALKLTCALCFRFLFVFPWGTVNVNCHTSFISATAQELHVFFFNTYIQIIRNIARICYLNLFGFYLFYICSVDSLLMIVFDFLQLFFLLFTTVARANELFFSISLMCRNNWVIFAALLALLLPSNLQGINRG